MKTIKNKIRPRAFKPKNDEWISVDWEALTTAEESARPWVLTWDCPIMLGELAANLVWQEGLEINYDWKPENKAHCLIIGELLHSDSPEGTEARARLARGCTPLGPYSPTGVF